ncbi:acetoacetate decarboxylase family protein [Azospirillum sp.]|uniref:acetoacetate decarboxylase family protein n=1 Tax=Azospirillum sp. TaxID=34012 RepID=UPI002D4C8A3E|nr:acetoacetate decarboxylase family protein [Azospirillum sp.]HYF90088.1 acetoacetate decarboxylase family protein [Azospirillum sp.]
MRALGGGAHLYTGCADVPHHEPDLCDNALIRMSRSFVLSSPAALATGPGGLFVGTLSHRDRRLVEASVRLEEETDERPNAMLARMINMRYFPRLDQGRRDRPDVHELVRQRVRDTAMSTVWRGPATLEIGRSPWSEIGDLAPLRVGHGYRYSFAMTVDDLLTVRDLRTDDL